MMTFKVYDPNNNAVFLTSLSDLMELTGATYEEARKATVKRVCNVKGTEVINLAI